MLKLTAHELNCKYKTTVICDILTETETVIYVPNEPSVKKKMNQISSVAIDDTTTTNEITHKMMIEQSNTASNKEALKAVIHDIHNFMRNNGVGYGMTALKTFNVMYGLKKIEEVGLIDATGLKKPDCEFSYLLKLANDGEGEMLASLILGSVLDSIAESVLRNLLFYEIPKKLKGKVFIHLIKEINKITLIEKTCNVLLSGKIYEYFIGRDETAISELGAYFTDRPNSK